MFAVQLSRTILLASASGLALAVGAGVSWAEQPAGLYAVLEGGAACAVGGKTTLESGIQIDNVFPLASTNRGGGCVVAGRIGIAREHRNMR